MTMTLGDLLEMVRQDYVDLLQETGGELAASGGKVVYEVPFRDENGEITTEGALNLPARIDLAVARGDEIEPVQVEAEGVFRFDGSVDLTWENGMAVQVFPFGWDLMPVRLEGLGAAPDWTPLQQWFERWFMEPEDETGDGSVVREVVHYLSDPDVVPEGVTLTADMGTAPLEAWQDLLDACAACGAKKVVVGSEERGSEVAR